MVNNYYHYYQTALPQS